MRTPVLPRIAPKGTELWHVISTAYHRAGLILLAAKNEAFIQIAFPRIARENDSKRPIPIEASLLAGVSFSTARRITKNAPWLSPRGIVQSITSRRLYRFWIGKIVVHLQQAGAVVHPQEGAGTMIFLATMVQT